MRRDRSWGFTLVELLVVIGIIALLISILIPTLSAARKSAQSLKCLSNLRQCGLAFHMYASANKQYLPYPTTQLITTAGDPEGYLWFIALDPYFGASTKNQVNRTGVAANRTYMAYKQCPVYDTFEGEKSTGAQSNTKEFARTFKMNSHLRHNNPKWYAKITEVKHSADFVLLGDGISMDFTGPVASQFESGQFSMEVNDKTQANPALRHKGGANILFVDGHARSVGDLKTIDKNLRAPQSGIVVKSWQSEFVNAGGNPVDLPDPTKTPEAQGLTRNVNMQLYWSDPPRLYRP